MYTSYLQSKVWSHIRLDFSGAPCGSANDLTDIRVPKVSATVACAVLAHLVVVFLQNVAFYVVPWFAFGVDEPITQPEILGFWGALDF